MRRVTAAVHLPRARKHHKSSPPQKPPNREVHRRPQQGGSELFELTGTRQSGEGPAAPSKRSPCGFLLSWEAREHLREILRDASSAPSNSGCAAQSSTSQRLSHGSRASLRESLHFAYLLALARPEPRPSMVPLSNVKRLFRSRWESKSRRKPNCQRQRKRYQIELSETALGHSKLSELLPGNSANEEQRRAALKGGRHEARPAFLRHLRGGTLGFCGTWL